MKLAPFALTSGIALRKISLQPCESEHRSERNTNPADAIVKTTVGTDISPALQSTNAVEGIVRVPRVVMCKVCVDSIILVCWTRKVIREAARAAGRDWRYCARRYDNAVGGNDRWCIHSALGIENRIVIVELRASHDKDVRTICRVAGVEYRAIYNLQQGSGNIAGVDAAVRKVWRELWLLSNSIVA